MKEIIAQLATMVRALIQQNRDLRAKVAEQQEANEELKKLLAEAQAGVNEGGDHEPSGAG